MQRGGWRGSFLCSSGGSGGAEGLADVARRAAERAEVAYSCSRVLNRDCSWKGGREGGHRTAMYAPLVDLQPAPWRWHEPDRCLLLRTLPPRVVVAFTVVFGGSGADLIGHNPR